MTQHIDPYPLLSRPVLKSKIWGGRNLERLFGIPLPPGERIGEAWMVADLPEGSSAIGNGPLEGRPLADVSRLWGEDLIGPAWRGKPTGGRFPLLVKLLDAQDDLSVQVHPDTEACRNHFPNEFSKDESWIIVDREPGGTILDGFVPGTTLEDFDRLLAEDRVVECLRAIEVQPGEVYRIAPGTVHALCRGVCILEIQEPSDTTFRIYDYGRMGDDGKPRPTHIAESRKVMRFGDETPPRAEASQRMTDWGIHELLVDVPAYRIERLTIRRPVEWTIDSRTAQVAIVLEGMARLESAGAGLDLSKGESVILPAALDRVSLKAMDDGVTVVLAGAGGVPLSGD